MLFRRVKGGVSFLVSFATYQSYFGNVAGDYWLGLNNMNTLSSLPGGMELRADVVNGTTLYYTRYQYFTIGSGTSYQLGSSGWTTGNLSSSCTLFTGSSLIFRTSDNPPFLSTCFSTYKTGGWW
jgi:hypothetical protein